MCHAKEKVTLQEYFDKKSVVSEGIPEIEKYMSEVLPKSGGHAESDDAVKDIVNDTSEYI